MDRIFSLKLFPGKIHIPNIKIESKVTVLEKKLKIIYNLTGELEKIIIPSTKTKPVRIYDLWEHTCFELFIKKKENPWYIEYNFSPSGDWNCFYISSYRVNAGEFDQVKGQTFEANKTSDKLTLRCDIRLDLLPDITHDDFKTGKMEIGISSVIEDRDDKLSYYALIHKQDKPDFHDGFVGF